MRRQSTRFGGFAAWIALGLLSFTAGPSLAETRLVMVEEMGCIWCARWDEEIAPIYPKTAEGAAAPLRRIDFHEPVPDDLEFDRKVRFTPTFVLVVEGKETARIEGYPGEDFFWGLLGMMLSDAEVLDEHSG